MVPWQIAWLLLPLPFVYYLGTISGGITNGRIITGTQQTIRGVSRLSASKIPHVSFNIEPDGDYFNGTGIIELCVSTVWVPERWLWCDGIEGGTTNARNAILHCLRYAMETGSGFIMPSLRLRGAVRADDVSLSSGGRGGIDTFFDIDLFKENIQLFCPQMAIVDTVEDITNYQHAWYPNHIRAQEIYKLATGKDPDNPTHVNTHVGTFRKDFDFLFGDGSAGNLLIFRLTWPLYFEWTITSDDRCFWQTFGRLLSFNTEIQAYASLVYTALSSLNTEYFGVHLRTEADIPQAGSWTSFEAQSQSYVQQAIESKLELMYIASGDYSDIETIRKIAASEGNIMVVHKGTLLAPTHLRSLERLSFDKQAAIDYLVLLRSTLFAGAGPSSFSQNIAIRRHSLSDAKDTPFHFSGDELSSLIDAEGNQFFSHTVWP